MPMMMYNGVPYGGGQKYIELTQAEYDALEVIEADTLYFITDGQIGTDAGMGNTDISKIGDGTVTGAIGALSEKTTFNYQTPTFHPFHCTGTATASQAQISYSDSGKTVQICGRIIIGDFVRTDFNPGVYVDLPFSSNENLEFCAGHRIGTDREVVLVKVDKNSNKLLIVTSETYVNASNGTLILIVPLVTIQVP